MFAALAAIASSPLFAVAGTALSVAGAIGEAQTRKGTARYRAQVAATNKVIAEQNIEASRKAEKVDLDTLARSIRSGVGSTRAAAAASGLDINAEGETGVQLVRDVQRAGSFKLLQLRHKFELDRRSMAQQAMKASAEGDLLTMQANSISPAMAGLTAGMSSLSQGLLTAQQLQRYGTP